MTYGDNRLDAQILTYVEQHLRGHEPGVEATRSQALSAAAFVARPAPTWQPVFVQPLKIEPVTLSMSRKALVRPAFTTAIQIAKLPTLRFPLLPTPAPNTPIAANDTWLWPDAAAKCAYFMLTRPVRMEFSLMVERDADYRVTGGTATLAVGVFPENRNAERTWADALRRAGHDARGWRFDPLRLNRLDADVDLPGDHVVGAPKTTVNPRLGTAIFLIDLTALGAQVWQQALAGGAAPPGVCSVTAHYVAADNQGRMSARRQAADAPVATVLAGARPEAVRVVDPEIGVDATLVLDGDPAITAITVEMRALNGTVRTESFGAEGGTVTLRMVTANPRAERVDWSVRVAFATASWPPLRIGGTLSDASGWSDLISPASWMRAVSVTTILLDAGGTVLAGDQASASNRVTGAIDFTAPFLDTATSLQAGFETSSQESTTIMVPRPPHEPPGELKLTVFALRGGLDAMTVRNLAVDEEWVVVKVYANARIEVVTNRTPGAENAREGGVLDVTRAMAALVPG